MDGAKTLLTLLAFHLGACSSYGVSPGIAKDAGLEPEPDAATIVAKVLYVAPAPAGSPTNDGSMERPIDTLGAAIAFASSNKLTGYEIHACRGTYTERDFILKALHQNSWAAFTQTQCRKPPALSFASPISRTRYA
jgi:hypothetical protein